MSGEVRSERSGFLDGRSGSGRDRIAGETTMIPVRFPESNTVLARNQDNYEPLEAHAFKDAEGRIAVCFRLSDVELSEIIATRTLWVQQLTFNNRFQPILLSTKRPEDLPSKS